MMSQVPRTQRTEAATGAAALMSTNALKSKSILSVLRLFQQEQQELSLNDKQQRDTKLKSQPNQLETSSSMRDIFVGDNLPYANTPIKVYAAAGNIDAANALVKVYPTLPPSKAGASSLSDASIVLRIPTTLCLSGAHAAPLHATSLAPTATTCEPLARVGAAAIVGPEMLATNRATCRTDCSLILMTPASALRRELVKDEEELEPVAKQTKYLADYKRCWPPPMFIVLVSVLEIFVFSYDYITIGLSTAASTTVPELMGGGTPLDISIKKTFDTSETSSSALTSALIYRPDRRLEIWRFVSYMLLHANWLHLSFNVVVQLMCGLPLELVHGSVRVGIIYLAGVFAGSLGTSIVDSQVYLMGASGGVYALLTANLANILLNYGQMRHVIVQMLRAIVIVFCDLCYACYTKYNNNNNKITTQSEFKAVPTISYIGHLTGALAGFTVGLLVLKNLDYPQVAHAKLFWWLALSVYSAFTTFAIAFNLINTVTAQILEEKGEVMEQQLLNNLGFS